MKRNNVIMLVLSIIVIIVSYTVLCTYKNYNIVKYGEKDMELYEKLIDKIVTENEDKIKAVDYIAIDTDSFNIVSEKDKTRMIAFLKKYKKSALLASYSMLTNDLFVDEESKAVLLFVSDVKRDANRITGNVYIRTSNLDSKGLSFKASYSYNKWNIKYTFKTIS